MRKVIDGKVYDTKTADFVCDISPPGSNRGDFRFEDTGLYKSPKGTFFIAGEGGPLSRWAQAEGQNGRRSGEGLQLLEIEAAKVLCQQHGSVEDFTEAFGEPEPG